MNVYKGKFTMKLNNFSILTGVAAFAVLFALIAIPFATSATNLELPSLELPSTELSGSSLNLTTSSLTLTPVTCKISLDNNEIVSGGSVTVYWDTTGLDEIIINGQIVNGDSGQVTLTNVTENTTFTLYGANHKGGTCTTSVHLKCLPPVVKECELELIKTVDKTTAKVGEHVTYEITVANTGNKDCTGGGVKIYDEIDSNLQFISQTYTSNFGEGYGGKGVNHGDGILRWNGHTIEPGESGTISWTGKVKNPNQCGDFEVHNKAKATAKELNNFQDWRYSNKVTTTIDNDCSTPTPPECPIQPAQDRIIVDFGKNARIYSNRGESNSYTSTQSFNVPAGQYDIRLVSYDGYVGRENTPAQIHEQYQLQFLNGDSEVARSNAISDLADGVEEDTNDEVVNNRFTLSGAATGLRAIHAFYGDNSSANSLQPICASLDPVEPDQLPSCDFFNANPASIDLGESLTLSWGTTNVTQVFINNGIGSQPVDGSLEVSPLDDTTYVLTAIGANDKTVDCHVRVEVDTTPERPVCPFTPDANTIVYDFDEKLRSDQSLGNSQTNIQPTSLEVGKYDVSLASWDGYPSRVTVTQPNEQWQLQFLSGTAEVGISNAISDLPDRIASAFIQEQVNAKYSLTAAADGIRAVHAVYPDISSPNSVNPICAAVTKVEDPAPSCDLFTASPTTITVGDTATLTWETSNATGVAINNGIGSQPVDGSIQVSPLVNTVYVLTVFGTDNRSVDCQVPVTVSEDPVPVCKMFTATPGNLPVGGGDVVLDWEVEKATSVTISPTVGAVGLIGSTSVNVTQSTTYTLTAVDANGDEVSCVAPVTVPDPVPFTCEGNVTFGASPNSVRSGSDVTLTWNVTDADSVSISEINVTSFSGSQTVNPTDDTTYVLTAVKGNDTITCPTSVTISTGGGGGGSSSPRCELDISDERISLGEEITITWDTSRANDVTLTDDLGNVIFSTEDMLSSDKDDYLDGEITLSPTRDTRYTLVAERGSRDRTCRVAVEVEDDIVILETRDQQPLVAGISLTSVPYTGFEAGPFMTFMFYALLIAWAFYIAYLVVGRKTAGVTASVTATQTTMKQAEATRPDVFVPSVTAPVAPPATVPPMNLPVGEPVVGYENVPVTDEIVTAIENRAHSQKALLSSDAIRHFVATTENQTEREVALDKVIDEAKKAYPLEDGWIVINESRMQNLCVTCQVHMAESHQVFVPASVTVPEGSSSLAEAIVTGNVVAAYELIGHRPMFSLADAAADLDAVYRKRNGEDKIVSDLLASETANLSDEQIKNMISALTSALDGTYTDEASAVKMAIMKAVKEVG